MGVWTLFFHSIVALQNLRGGKDLIEHMNDNANSELVERLNFRVYKYRIYLLSFWCVAFTLQGKAVYGGSLYAEVFFLVLYGCHTVCHLWWYKPIYHHY